MSIQARGDAIMDMAKARFTRGQGYETDEAFAEAADVYAQGLATAPDDVNLLYGLGSALYQLSRLEEAAPLLAKAVRLAPDRPDIHCRLVETLYAWAEDDACWIEAHKLLAAHPEHPMGLSLLARLLAQRSDFDGALDAFERSIDRSLDAASVFTSWTADRRKGCDWRAYERTTSFVLDCVRRGWEATTPLDFMMTFDSTPDVAIATRTFARRYPAMPAMPVRATRRPGRIRVGYLSADLRAGHPVGRLITPVIERHDREAFEISVIQWVTVEGDPARERINAAVDHVIDVDPLDDDQLAQVIHDQDLDILVELNGFTAGGRYNVLARRPAPIQVSLLGYPGSMHLPYIDYTIADKGVVPPEDLEHFDEKIAWLPDSYQPTDDKALIMPVPPTRAQEGLPQNAFVFAAFAQPQRLTPQMFGTWLRILEQVPNGVLWLSDQWSISQGNLRAIAAANRVDPNRIVFARYAKTHAEHLARHRLADLSLSPYPYVAHSTSTESLWVSVPIITLRGHSWASRVCASHLNVAGLSHLIADTLGDYERLAVSLARDPARLEKVRKQVKASRRGPLFDTTRYTRHLEAAFRAMHERRMQGLAPETIEVPALRPTRR